MKELISFSILVFSS